MTFTKLCLLASLLLTLATPIVAKSSACKQADALNQRAFTLHQQKAPTTQLKDLLKQALQMCPKHAQANNNLADILTEEGQYSQAINHYQIATAQNLPQAWYGLGEAYYKIGQFPLSLEAHLHTCTIDKDSKKRVKQLLENNNYAITSDDKILNKESLLSLYDPKHRAKIEQMLGVCGLRAKLIHVIAFRNLKFKSGTDKLKAISLKQLQKLAIILKLVQPNTIKVSGHTDKQRWRGKSRAESDKLNLKLSKRRAKAVKQKLANQGIAPQRIQTQGYGSTKPMVEGNSKTAYEKNRRVEVEAK